MTEDDTFARLKRIPFESMRTIYNTLQSRDIVGARSIEADRAFTDNGWTRREYYLELSRRISIALEEKYTGSK